MLHEALEWRPRLFNLWLNAVAYGRHGFCGLQVRGDKHVLHAVTPEAVLARFGDNRSTFDSPCGRQVRIIGGEVGLFMWPPRVALLPEGITRCPECHDLTGRRRPAKEWVAT